MNAPPLMAAFEHPQADRQVLLAGMTRVAYRLRRSQRSSIGLQVNEQGLTVCAPLRAHQVDIEQALQSKAGWILRKLVQQRERARQHAACAITWADGAVVPCLGGLLRVRLVPGLSAHQGPVLVSLLEQGPVVAGQVLAELQLALPLHASADAIRDATAYWLQHQALALFQWRCALYAPRLGVRPTQLTLSAARTRWGSATAGGVIRLNWHLIHFDLAVIDYVVVHELAHLRQMNHSPAFWALVHALIPNVDACKAALRQRPPPVWG